MRLLLGFLAICFSLVCAADPITVRWTGKEDPNPDLVHVLDKIGVKTGLPLSVTDFLLLEQRPLHRSHFVFLVQMAGKVPMRGQSLRIWTTPGGETLQVDARVSAPPSRDAIHAATRNVVLDSRETMEIVRRLVAAHPDDRVIRGVSWQDYWDYGTLVRVVTAKAGHGTHTIVVRLDDGSVVSSEYREFPQSGHDEFSVHALVYPIYEEVDDGAAQILPRIPSDLKYLKPRVPLATTDPYGILKQLRYFESKLDPVLGLTAEGRKQGFWSNAYVKKQAAYLLAALPTRENSWPFGVALEGRYVSISLHPQAPEKFKNLSFKPQPSGNFRPDWRPIQGSAEWEMIPTSAFHGRRLQSPVEGIERPARRLPDHDPASYINDGFDELQVYWAVNQMFDSLRPMGFLDPELSTRPFHAFLYDPDISYRDNAYYTDDTINFTTYSPKNSNMARDNTTIWHELGHGVMDRLMGDHITLADTGGLSEGMADFVAQLVVDDVTQGVDFPGKYAMRIFNKTGFNLTNEVHDDGEAYGGAMNDMLRSALKAQGRQGLVKVTDLTLEAMRLARNHPALTANDWFERMLFSDDLGNPPLRTSGELRPLIIGALAGRNFSLGGAPVARFTLKHGADEVTATGPGSRPNPIPVRIQETETKSFPLSVALLSTAAYSFRYPITVKVQLRGGPLQGAIHWEGEETQPLTQVLASESDVTSRELTVRGKCDEVNRPDGSCVDFAYVQIWNHGETDKPVAKKRFYLRVYPSTPTPTPPQGDEDEDPR